jgi:proteasome accessory factor C
MTSPRTAQRLTRILSMLPWVIAHPGATVADVCARFGYTPGELGKDLNLVFVCGLPGYGPGDLMDAYIDGEEVVVDTADYFARSVRLTAGEGLMLLSGGMALLASGAAPPALASAVEKLQQALVPDDGSFAVDLPAEPELVDLLRRAAAGGEVVRITHTSIAADRTTTREIEPWRVFATMGNWYVSGHCRMAAGERVFRIDRIRDAEPTGEHFQPPAEPPPPEVRYTPGVDDVEAVIRLEPEAAWVADCYPVEVIEQDERGATIRFSASDPAVTARLLVRLGDRAEVVEGDSIRTAARDLRTRMLRRYGVSG